MTSDGPDVSRRKLLYGLATAGIGVGSGAVTAAALTDIEEFAGNLQSAGEVDIEACWEDAGASSDCMPTDGSGPRIDLGKVSSAGEGGSGLVRIRVPDVDEQNPAFVWLRTSCPVDADGLEEKLDVYVWRDEDCDATEDSGETQFASGRLCGVLTTLHGGVLIDGDPSTSDVDPFRPGDEACIGFEWELAEDLGGADSIDIDFEFHATQSRNSGPQNPWPNASCQASCGGNSKAISFVAFCSPDGFNSDDPITSISTTYRNESGEPVAVEWESDESVDTVVIKSGGGQNALYNFDVGGATSGTTRLDTTTDDPDPGSDQSPSSPCPSGSSGVKYEYNETNDAWDGP